MPAILVLNNFLKFSPWYFNNIVMLLLFAKKMNLKLIKIKKSFPDQIE